MYYTCFNAQDHISPSIAWILKTIKTYHLYTVNGLIPLVQVTKRPESKAASA